MPDDDPTAHSVFIGESMNEMWNAAIAAAVRMLEIERKDFRVLDSKPACEALKRLRANIEQLRIS